MVFMLEVTEADIHKEGMHKIIEVLRDLQEELPLFTQPGISFSGCRFTRSALNVFADKVPSLALQRVVLDRATMFLPNNDQGTLPDYPTENADDILFVREFHITELEFPPEFLALIANRFVERNRCLKSVKFLSSHDSNRQMLEALCNRPAGIAYDSVDLDIEIDTQHKAELARGILDTGGVRSITIRFNNHHPQLLDTAMRGLQSNNGTLENLILPDMERLSHWEQLLDYLDNNPKLQLTSILTGQVDAAADEKAKLNARALEVFSKQTKLVRFTTPDVNLYHPLFIGKVKRHMDSLENSPNSVLADMANLKDDFRQEHHTQDGKLLDQLEEAIRSGEFYVLQTPRGMSETATAAMVCGSNHQVQPVIATVAHPLTDSDTEEPPMTYRRLVKYMS
jgi:hypothetical protein